jgi:hypothetical protein
MKTGSATGVSALETPVPWGVLFALARDDAATTGLNGAVQGLSVESFTAKLAHWVQCARSVSDCLRTKIGKEQDIQVGGDTNTWPASDAYTL